MAIMRRLDDTGDHTVTWEHTANPTQEQADAVREAERIFEETAAMRKYGFVAFHNGVKSMISTFDEMADEIIAIPRIVGG